MTSSNGIDWEIDTETTVGGRSVCWSPELGIFVAVGENTLITSPNGIVWTEIIVKTNNWNSVCWSPELGIFVAVAISINNDGVITSSDGITWTSRTTPDTGCNSVCWSSELGIFVAVASVSNINTTIMTSYNGINWTIATTGGPGLTSVCWSPQLGIFVAVGPNSVMTSTNGTSWIVRNTVSSNWQNICWSPELGIFVAVAAYGLLQIESNKVMTSSLKGRPPTSYNVFDSSFNKIDENGKWTFSDVIISNAIEVPNNSIVGDKIATGTINLTKLGTSITSVLDAKAPSINPSFSGTITIPSGVSISSNGVTVTSAQLAFVSGATRNIQTQLTDLSNAKAPSANPSFTGTVTLPANTINSSHIITGSILGEDICSNTITDANIAVGTITQAKLATAVQAKLDAVGGGSASNSGVFEITNSNSSQEPISVTMRYLNTSSVYVYQFQNVSILVGEVMYISYTLPNNFATITFQLLVSAGIDYRLDKVVPFSFSQSHPENGISNTTVNNARDQVSFNIQRNAHQYLEIILLVNNT